MTDATGHETVDVAADRVAYERTVNDKSRGSGHVLCSLEGKTDLWAFVSDNREAEKGASVIHNCRVAGRHAL